jgi:molecular chaperone HscA
MLRDSFEHARDDMHARALHEARVDAGRLLEATRAALAADGGLLESAERAAIEEKAAALETALGRTDSRALRAGIEALNRATEEFAARRMDAGVRRALAGRRIASLDL